MDWGVYTQIFCGIWAGLACGAIGLGIIKSRWRAQAQHLLAAPEPPKLLPQRAQSRQAPRTRPPASMTRTRPSRNVTYPSRPTQGQRPASQPAPRTRTVPPMQQARPVAQTQQRRQATRPPTAPARRAPQWDN